MRVLSLLIIILVLSCNQRTQPINTEENKDWILTKTLIKEGLHDIEAPSDSIAFAYSYGTGNVYKTESGGVYWKRIHQFDSIFFEQIQFLNDSVGWICGSPNKLYKTENGGKDWTDYSLKQEPEDILIYGMYFRDTENGYVAAGNRKKDRSYVSNIYATQDAGKSWTLVNTIEGLILNLEEIQGSVYGSGDYMIIKDIDQKENWKYSFLDTLEDVRGIRDLQTNDQGKIIATGFRGHIVKQIYGSWKTQRITKNWLRNLTWVKDSTWIAVGDALRASGNMYISKDNGEHWEMYHNYYTDIHRIVKSESKLWVVGKQGLILTKDIESFK
ncbi:YCF48-related protein [Aquimarina gracilis]|uniref:YCF48-related protein n=1 Tax=Aquimarina gracilis TaxID=874422 RepID=A0ABU5ZX11_9FLAO|nr:YCF48-related protein [Aquimarina gracilis]MEB3346415.1 YCF48-related protein [Aquimarina gracilis]